MCTQTRIFGSQQTLQTWSRPRLPKNLKLTSELEQHILYTIAGNFKVPFKTYNFKVKCFTFLIPVLTVVSQQPPPNLEILILAQGALNQLHSHFQFIIFSLFQSQQCILGKYLLPKCIASMTHEISYFNFISINKKKQMQSMYSSTNQNS